MIYELSNIIAAKFTGAWTDRKVGIVRTLKVNGDLLPFECGVSESDCTKQKAVLPDEKRKSVLYMELDKEPTFEYHGNVAKGSAQMTMVVWLNGKKLGTTDCDLSSLVMGDILRQLNSWGSFNEGSFNTIKVQMISQRPKDVALFTKYGMNESFRFYVTPYDFLAIRLSVNFVAKCSEWDELDAIC